MIDDCFGRPSPPRARRDRAGACCAGELAARSAPPVAAGRKHSMGGPQLQSASFLATRSLARSPTKNSQIESQLGARGGTDDYGDSPAALGRARTKQWPPSAKFALDGAERGKRSGGQRVASREREFGFAVAVARMSSSWQLARPARSQKIESVILAH